MTENMFTTETTMIYSGVSRYVTETCRSETLTNATAKSRPSAEVKMSMNGNPVTDVEAAAKSGVTNRTASIMPSPSTPFAAVENHMLNGITEAAFSISSAI